MSIAIQLSSITPELKVQITKKCLVKPNVSQYNEDPAPVSCFAVNEEEDTVYLPLGVWKDFLDEFPDRKYTRTKVKCKKELYTLETDPKGFRDQNIVFEEALERLKTDNCVFLACSPGFGKTTIGNYLSGVTKLKTVVLSHLDSINDQWEQEFKNFSTAKVQRIQGKKPIDHSADVYIVGVQKAATLVREELTDIGLLIFDEAHICTVSAFSKSLLKFQPKYVVGLSATPKRADGMDKLLTMYFGPKKSFITRKEVKDFTVIKVETNFKPEIKYQMVKRRMVPNWCIITNSIACNEDRQNLIVNLCLKHPDERILVLSDRQEQSRAVADKLIALGENVQLLIGAKK